MKLRLFCLLLLSIANINCAQVLQKDGITVSYEQHWGSFHCPPTVEFGFPYYITIENNSLKKCIVHPAIIKNQLPDRMSIFQSIHRRYNARKATGGILTGIFIALKIIDRNKKTRDMIISSPSIVYACALLSAGISIFYFIVDSTVETKMDAELITFPLSSNPVNVLKKLYTRQRKARD